MPLAIQVAYKVPIKVGFHDENLHGNTTDNNLIVSNPLKSMKLKKWDGSN